MSKTNFFTFAEVPISGRCRRVVMRQAVTH